MIDPISLLLGGVFGFVVGFLVAGIAVRAALRDIKSGTFEPDRDKPSAEHESIPSSVKK